VEGGEEGAQGVRRRQRPPPEAAEPRDVVQAVTAGGAQQPQRFDRLDLRGPARPLPHLDVRGDDPLQPERAQRLQPQGEPGPPGHRVRVLGHLSPPYGSSPWAMPAPPGAWRGAGLILIL